MKNLKPLVKDKKYTLIVSGGMDSVTLLYYTLEFTAPENVYVLSVNYGQKHSKELIQASKICKNLGVSHKVLDLSNLQNLLTSSLTDDNMEVPEGHYAQDNMKQTVVPNRNAIMISLAWGYAISNGSDYLLFGAHSGDHFIYPDCRPDFADALNTALRIGNEGFGDVELLAPLINISKTQVTTLGLSLSVPYEDTWTCYKGGERPCLSCGTCVERTEAFLENNEIDPLLSSEEWSRAVEYYQLVTK